MQGIETAGNAPPEEGILGVFFNNADWTLIEIAIKRMIDDPTTHPAIRSTMEETGGKVKTVEALMQRHSQYRTAVITEARLTTYKEAETRANTPAAPKEEKQKAAYSIRAMSPYGDRRARRTAPTIESAIETAKDLASKPGNAMVYIRETATREDTLRVYRCAAGPIVVTGKQGGQWVRL